MSFGEKWSPSLNNMVAMVVSRAQAMVEGQLTAREADLGELVFSRLAPKQLTQTLDVLRKT